MVENQSTSTRKYPKRIPYGMMNFKAVIEDDCYYVDKTPFVEKIERANKFFFYLRPRDSARASPSPCLSITTTLIEQTSSTSSSDISTSVNIPHPNTTNILSSSSTFR